MAVQYIKLPRPASCVVKIADPRIHHASYSSSTRTLQQATFLCFKAVQRRADNNPRTVCSYFWLG